MHGKKTKHWQQRKSIKTEKQKKKKKENGGGKRNRSSILIFSPDKKERRGTPRASKKNCVCVLPTGLQKNRHASAYHDHYGRLI
jgi:hypothetical protein